MESFSSFSLCRNIRIVMVAASLSVASGFLSQYATQRSVHCTYVVNVNNNNCHLSSSRDESPCLYSQFDDNGNDIDQEGGDDEAAPDLGDQDWRAFRAKLVMSEPDQTSSSSSQNTEQESAAATIIEEEDDLDGIGAVFAKSQPDTPKSKTIDTPNDSNKMSNAEKVMQSYDMMTPLDPSQWAYDSGKVIEKGAVILGGVEQDYGFGLRQQYFHKASILILDHDDNVFTKGIILNRPTDIMLQDDDTNNQWRVWFGGDVQGINSPNPEIICLHSLADNDDVAKASTPIMKDIQWTTFDEAKRLVQEGHAKTTDFWIFCGYAGWGPNQLLGELDRQSWYMVATDSQTLLKELARLSSGADPRDAGLDTWTLLMNMIGRGETAEECDGDFDDLILKEWAREHLLSSEAGGGAGMKNVRADDIRTDPISALTQILAAATSSRANRLKRSDRGGGNNNNNDFKVGSLLCASSDDRSPFLLDNQEFHKSLVLVIGDDDNLSVGAILNRPSAKDLDMQITDKTTSKSEIVAIPLRYGGKYAVKGTDPLLWLHCDPRLRAAQIGSPFKSESDDDDDDDSAEDDVGIWKCTAEDVTGAVQRGLAKPQDFIVVSGVCVWTKGQLSSLSLSGMQEVQVKPSFFNLVPPSKIADVWGGLIKQEKLTNIGLRKYIDSANEVWNIAANSNKSSKEVKGNNQKHPPPISGLGEGFDEEDDTLVFGSDVKVSKLADDALLSWIATFLLAAPTLGV